MNNTVNKVILDRGSCEKLHKKFRFADPVFITSGINIFRLQNAFRSAKFFKIRFFGLSNDPNEISNVKKKSLKNIKYWQRNGGFKFWPEVRITCLIDTFSAVFSNQHFHLKRTL